VSMSVFGMVIENVEFSVVFCVLSMLCGSLSPQHGASSGSRGTNGLQLWRVAANILNKQQRTNDKGWSSSLGVGHWALG
jgi:hypothetical protein